MNHSATYSPEDDKIRLYFSERIPREEWDALRALGFTWTMKQAEAGGCDMVAVWSVRREDAALALAGEIDDEDQPRAERAAQRAERFAGFQDKREGEAVASANNYDMGPTIHGNQSARHAEKAAQRHDKAASFAVSQWSKAEYWQQRTAGVISHALYAERPDVRHRRIKGLEAEARKLRADYEVREVVQDAEQVLRYMGQEKIDKGHDSLGWVGQGRAKYPVSFSSVQGWRVNEGVTRSLRHVELRIAYEKQMLEAQGGTGADATEMEAGGFVDGHRIVKLTKDRAGRISKVVLEHPPGPVDYWSRYNCVKDAESIKPESYRMPTQAEREAWKAEKASEDKGPPLINPDADACAALLASANGNLRPNQEPAKVSEMTSEDWKEKTARSDSWCVRKMCGARIRTGSGFGYRIAVVVVLIDKPRKPLPVAKAEANAAAG